MTCINMLAKCFRVFQAQKSPQKRALCIKKLLFLLFLDYSYGYSLVLAVLAPPFQLIYMQRLLKRGYFFTFSFSHRRTERDNRFRQLLASVSTSNLRGILRAITRIINCTKVWRWKFHFFTLFINTHWYFFSLPVTLAVKRGAGCLPVNFPVKKFAWLIH